jgi:hypothetical protein
MAPKQTIDFDDLALERAAKYICTLKSGMCPMTEENFTCRTECDLETRPWQCWIDFFKKRPRRTDDGNNGRPGLAEEYRDPEPADDPPAHFPKAA